MSFFWVFLSSQNHQMISLLMTYAIPLINMMINLKLDICRNLGDILQFNSFILSISSTKRRRKKIIRRIIDDAELGEETKKKIAIEKVRICSAFILVPHINMPLINMVLQERQERLKALEARFSTKSPVISSSVKSRSSFDGTGVQILGDMSAGYIVNVVREEGEEAVRIPPSISTKLKIHQVLLPIIIVLLSLCHLCYEFEF